jgi:hypothetical protein
MDFAWKLLLPVGFVNFILTAVLQIFGFAWFAVGLGVTLAGLATLLTVYRIRRQVSAALAPAVA